MASGDGEANQGDNVGDAWSLVADAVSDQMAERGLSQRELANRKVISTTKLSALLNSYAPIGEQLQRRLSRALWDDWTVIERMLRGGPRPEPNTRTSPPTLEEREDRVAAAIERLAEVQAVQTLGMQALAEEQRSARRVLEALVAELRGQSAHPPDPLPPSPAG